MSQALYRKWRSQTFEEVIGQEHVTQTLRNALNEDRVAHAYLFSGPRGTGKTSSARILAKAINCEAEKALRPCNVCATCIAINEGRMLDLIEIDAASNNGVEDIRELRDKVSFRPSEGRYKIYIIDEVHMLSNSAFNALLKTLEEPPPHARFVLATTEPHKIPATVLSRCQRFDFRRIPVPEIVGHLQTITEAEKFMADEDALTAIARSAQGCMRDAVSLLDQMLSYGTETVSLEQVQQVLGAVNAETVSALVDALAIKDVGAGLTLIQQLLSDGSSLVEFCHQVIEQLRGVLVLQMTQNAALLNDLPKDVIAQMQAQAKQIPQATTIFAIKRFSEAIADLKGGYQPQLPLEMALIESMQGAPVTAPSALVQPVAVAAAVANAPASAAATESATPAVAAPSPAQNVASISPKKETIQSSANNGANDAANDESEDELPPLDEAAIKKLQSQWKTFLGTVREQLGIKVRGGLNSVRDIVVGETSVVLAFGNNSFSRDMIDAPETRDQVAALLSEFLGRKMLLECQVGDKARLSSSERAITQDVSDEGPDPLVEYAVNELGAEVVE